MKSMFYCTHIYNEKNNTYIRFYYSYQWLSESQTLSSKKDIGFKLGLILIKIKDLHF
jgi:hypothetical protein